MSRIDSPVDRMADFFNQLAASIGSMHSDPVLAGLTADEIAQVRVDQDVDKLPVYYEEYLRRMGRSAGPFLVGTDAFFPRILGIKKDGLELLGENGVLDLMPRDAVVFAMHQGYQLYWLHPCDAEDPAVLMYEEGESDIYRQWESFSSFLTDELQEEIELTR